MLQWRILCAATKNWYSQKTKKEPVGYTHMQGWLLCLGFLCIHRFNQQWIKNIRKKFQKVSKSKTWIWSVLTSIYSFYIVFTTIHITFILCQILQVISGWFKIYGRVLVGFLYGTGTSEDFCICKGSWNQLPADTDRGVHKRRFTMQNWLTRSRRPRIFDLQAGDSGNPMVWFSLRPKAWGVPVQVGSFKNVKL